MRQSVLYAALALAVSLLPGCAQLPVDDAALANSVRPIQSARPARAAIDAFTIDGRIAVREAERNHAANIYWRHAATTDEIFFTTMLGQGLAELTRNASGARLQLADRREFNAADWESLVAQLFGFALPLSVLPRWLIGDFPNAASDVVRDASGRPLHLSIDGWRIDYRAYESTQVDALPTLIELRRDDIEIKLKVDEWQLPP